MTDVDLLNQLIKLNERYRILFEPPAIAKSKLPTMGKTTCAFCNSTRVTLPINVNVCQNCARNRFNIADYKTHAIYSLFGYCQLCYHDYKLGYKVYSVPVCSVCATKIQDRRTFNSGGSG